MPLTWLHLTDLHLGLSGQEYLFPNMRERFLRDLEFVAQNHSGPIDLILFTGDMVQRGDRHEFDQFEKLMLELRVRVAPEAAFLAIPGNHDLTRPAKAADAAVAGLIQLWDMPKTDVQSVQDYFWQEASSSQRKVVEQAFENYLNWWKTSALNPVNWPRGHGDSKVLVEDYVEGLLPGDFRCLVLKDGLSLGIIGLNSTFLQLLGGDFQGKLSVGPQQIAKLCPEGLPDWVARNHLAFLLTHHPPGWLTPTALQDLQEEINEPGRFALHLFGHMHESAAGQQAYGNSSERRHLQGRSLFGMEFIGESKKVERSHGYSIGRIAHEGGAWQMKIWPRYAERVKGVGFRFGSDRGAGELISDLYFEYVLPRKASEVRIRRLRATDATYFRNRVYPVLAARIPGDELKPVEEMAWWLREPDPTYLDHFLVAEMGDEPVGFLYFGGVGDSEYLFVSYLVVKEAEAGQKLDATSRLLLTELRRLSLARKSETFLMELAHPGMVEKGKERTERLGRMRLFSKLGKDYGFEVRALDMKYVQPALLGEVEDIPHLLALARPFQKGRPDWLSREQASRILHLVYDVYPLGFSTDEEETTRFAQRCASIRERLVSQLPERVELLSDRQIEQRFLAL